MKKILVVFTFVSLLVVGILVISYFTLFNSPKPAGLVSVSLSDQKSASGIIKSVYNKSGKVYIDMDYIELNTNWVPGGVNGEPYKNSDSKTATLQLSSDAEFIVGSPATTKVPFSEFQKLFGNAQTYQKVNPWDITIVGGVVTKITEHFIP